MGVLPGLALIVDFSVLVILLTNRPTPMIVGLTPLLPVLPENTRRRIEVRNQNGWAFSLNNEIIRIDRMGCVDFGAESDSLSPRRLM